MTYNNGTMMRPDTLYSTNDRLVCMDCAGMSALYTRMTIGGAPVLEFSVFDHALYLAWDMTPKCECGKVDNSDVVIPDAIMNQARRLIEMDS